MKQKLPLKQTAYYYYYYYYYYFQLLSVRFNIFSLEPVDSFIILYKYCVLNLNNLNFVVLKPMGKLSYIALPVRPVTVKYETRSYPSGFLSTSLIHIQLKTSGFTWKCSLICLLRACTFIRVWPVWQRVVPRSVYLVRCKKNTSDRSDRSDPNKGTGL